MFLDDELLELCRNADCSTPEGVQKLYASLIDKCQDYYKSQIKPDMFNREVKVILDRTFNMWDSFVRMAEKEGNHLGALGRLCKEYSFKKQFLSDERMNEVYNKL